jgi:tetratricopeptide (TPR) repeat protein
MSRLSGPSLGICLLLLGLMTPMDAVSQEEDIEEIGEVRPPDYYNTQMVEGRRLRGGGDYVRALTTLAIILEEGDESEPYYQEAEYELALTFFNMGMFQSALGFIGQIVDKGEIHIRHRDSLQWLVRLHRKIPGNLTVLEQIDSYRPDLYPEALIDELNYLVGRFRYSNADLAGALERLNQVRKKGGSYFVRGRYLAGVIYVEQKKAREAEQSFKDVLRYVSSRGVDEPELRRFRDLSVMALARMFFTVGNHRAAERFYKRIPRTSELWLDAMYEMSWAYFHLGDYTRSMGNLWTLSSPYFENEYFPEVKLLQATILYASCNDREVIDLVTQFVPEFQLLKKEVKAILERTSDPNEFYFYLARLAQSRSSELSREVRRLFNAALSSRRVQRYFDFIIQLNREVSQMKRLMGKVGQSDMLARVMTELQSDRELIIVETGDLARERLVRVRKDVSALLTDSLRLKFETIRRLRKRIGADRSVVERVGTVEPIVVDDEHISYQFDGEYWLDELGDYLYEVRKRCVAE